MVLLFVICSSWEEHRFWLRKAEQYPKTTGGWKKRNLFLSRYLYVLPYVLCGRCYSDIDDHLLFYVHIYLIISSMNHWWNGFICSLPTRSRERPNRMVVKINVFCLFCFSFFIRLFAHPLNIFSMHFFHLKFYYFFLS